LRSTLLEPELTRQLIAHPELKDRGIVFLSGGAAYAMATLLKPEAVGEKRVDFTTRDIASYVELVRKTPITSPKLAGIKGTTAEKEVKNVFDIFTPTNLIAGSEVLSALATTLNLEGKTLRFDRTAILALIRGKVLDQAEADRLVGEKTALEKAEREKAQADTVAAEKAQADAVAAEKAQADAPEKAKAGLTNSSRITETSAKTPKAPSKSLPEASGPGNLH
jgi:hypothetical protein